MTSRTQWAKWLMGERFCAHADSPWSAKPTQCGGHSLILLIVMNHRMQVGRLWVVLTGSSTLSVTREAAHPVYSVYQKNKDELDKDKSECGDYSSASSP